MADNDGKREAPLFARASQGSMRSGQSRLFTGVSIVWFIFSIYPVFVYFSNAPTLPVSYQKPPTKPLETVTRTVFLPELPETALQGALPTDPPANAFRASDAINSFDEFKTSDRCKISSLDLHGPFQPLCEDKDSLLQAMTWGGRIGVDAPFSPRGCDMRWFSPAEICAILGRFERISVMGDSMMRNLAVALQIYLRADLVDGGHANWMPDPEGHDCRCEAVFDDRACAFHSVVSTSGVLRFDPDSYVCRGVQLPAIEYHHILEFPIKDDDLEGFTSYQPPTKPSKPIAFVMGHGLWNDLDREKTYGWIDQVMNATVERSPWLVEAGALFPRLFLTPNAAGDRKPDIFIARQGNIALTRFEKIVGAWVKERGIDHLGTYNMSIQAFNPDGTHGGMRVNLIKAMMVFNWLNAIDVTKH